ncbi:MAG: CGNR zinc finger domain-containing protein [Rhodococcus sp.]|nr:CGNR zinc finger domain-containing protein [Rhodococcus sp. (in: high G+C Gram-positive bacteria)]MBJ7325627.1 CGNR zinc finger domain-containing protein [Rhodococcus sp. (in: high G+C Gram-positive bacteria)]
MDTAEARAIDEALLIDLLNTTPVVDDQPIDLLAGDADGRDWLSARGGTGSAEELQVCRAVRDDLQRVVRGEASPSSLRTYLDGLSRVPVLTDDALDWNLQVAEDRRLAARIVLAWAEIRETIPGALRPCANDECRLFLLDRSRAGTARWCSMATCGNKMKARRHRARAAGE